MRYKDTDRTFSILHVLSANGSPEECEKYSRQALLILKQTEQEQTGLYLEYLRFLAEACRKQGKIKEALAIQQKRMNIDGDRSDIWLELGKIYRIQGKKSEALVAFQKVYDMSGDGKKSASFLEGFGFQYDALREMADVYREMKDYSKAEALQVQIIKLMNEGSIDLNRKARDLATAESQIAKYKFEQDNYEQALVHFQKGADELLKVNVNDSPILWACYRGIGDSYAAMKDFPQAEQNYKRVLQLAPKHSPAFNGTVESILDMYEKNGFSARAQEFSKSLRGDKQAK